MFSRVSAHLGFVAGFAETLRDRPSLQHGRVKQHIDTLLVGLRASLPDAVERFEQASNALLAGFTVQLLLADDLERDCLEHDNSPFLSDGYEFTLAGISGGCPTVLMASKK